MKIRVQFFAQLRDLAGTDELDVDLPEGSSVGDLLEKIYSQISSLRAHDKSILVGAGVEFVDRNYKLKAGDEISIMPPCRADRKTGVPPVTADARLACPVQSDGPEPRLPGQPRTAVFRG